jgi:hypothetical protein
MAVNLLYPGDIYKGALVRICTFITIKIYSIGIYLSLTSRPGLQSLGILHQLDIVWMECAYYINIQCDH